MIIKNKQTNKQKLKLTRDTILKNEFTLITDEDFWVNYEAQYLVDLKKNDFHNCFARTKLFYSL